MYRAALFFLVTACASAPAAVESQVPPGDDAPRTIRVDATGSVSRTPDRAVIHLAVETFAPTAAEATASNAASMDAVLAAVREQGVPERSIRTLRLELHPRYDRPREGQAPSIVGYQATNQVTVTVDSVPNVGAIVDAAVSAGANRVTGISFELQDPDRWRLEALSRAMEKARAEAEVIAAALGEPLGPALHVSTTGEPAPVVYDRRFAAAELAVESAQPPVEPGEIDVTARVSVVYRIGQ